MISPDGIPKFYRQYKRCLLKIVTNDIIKKKLLDFKFDNCSLVISMETYHKAKKAEKALNLEIEKTNTTRRRYEQAMKKAYYSFKKHIDFLNIAFYPNPDVRIALGLLDQVDLKSPDQWLIYALWLYQKILNDYPLLEQLDAFNITTDQLRQGLKNIQIAQEAYKKLIMEMPKAKGLIENRDGLILELQHIMFELEMILIYALEDKPGLIAELGLPIMHPLALIRVNGINNTLKKAKLRFKKVPRKAAIKAQINNDQKIL
jgi:hypothetical protein